MKKQTGRLAAALIEYFKNNKLKVYGINSADALNDAPEGFRPRDYLPEAKSFLCFALPVPASVYSLGSFQKEFVWRTQNLIYRELDTHSVRIANILEQAGHRALPLYGCLPQRYNAKKEIAGYLNQIMMGRAAGIGFVGKNGLLLNPLYGSRLMLGAVVTTAVLPVLSEPRLTALDCPAGCDICYRICPVQAIISRERRVKIMKCLAYTARAPNLPKLRFLLLRLFKPAKSIRLLNITSFDENTFHVCSLCVSECPYGKGRQGALQGSAVPLLR